MRRIVLTFAIALLCTPPAAAAEKDIKILGNGTSHCADWSASAPDPQSASAIAMKAWIGGFVTAFNAYAPHAEGDALSGRPADWVWTWMNNYCRAKPNEQLATAATALIGDLRIGARRP